MEQLKHQSAGFVSLRHMYAPGQAGTPKLGSEKQVRLSAHPPARPPSGPPPTQSPLHQDVAGLNTLLGSCTRGWRSQRGGGCLVSRSASSWAKYTTECSKDRVGLNMGTPSLRADKADGWVRGGGGGIWPRFNLFLLRISTPFHGTGTTAVNINRFYCSLQGTVPALHCTYDPGRSPGELDCGRGARSRRGTGAYYPVRTWTSSARTTPWIPWVKARCIKVLLY